jgi:triphosphoribosyl-dephospho-CoA synthase
MTLTPDAIAALAVSALREEALLTPKPGLVDRNGQGSHPDMTLAMLLDSADSLFDTFAHLARAGAEEPVGQGLRDRVGVLGRAGEALMLRTTGGVNTHRGALWTTGLLATAAGAAQAETDIFRIAGALAAIPDSAAAPSSSSHGQLAVRTYGVPGAVGEAAAGFPHIRLNALPTLRSNLAWGETVERAQLRALLALVATLDDTCVLHRGGAAGLRWMQASARRVQGAGCFDSALSRFVARAQRRRLSPGGSADLLSGAVFVDNLALPTTVAAEEHVHADV